MTHVPWQDRLVHTDGTPIKTTNTFRLPHPIPPPDRWINVRFSPDLLEMMEDGFSEPVRVRPVQHEDGTWELECIEA
jgi:hypothetical protein